MAKQSRLVIANGKNNTSNCSMVSLSDSFLLMFFRRLSVYPKGIYISDHLSLFLEVADVKSLPFGWRRLMKFRLTIAKQVSEGPSVLKKSHRWFDQKNPLWGFPTMIPLAKIHYKNEGFLVNDQLMIVAEVDVLEVVGTSEKSEETNSLSQVYVESVSSIQGSVVEFRARNQHLKTACTNVLLSLTQTLCQTPQGLSADDLVEAGKTLAYMKDFWLGGFSVSSPRSMEKKFDKKFTWVIKDFSSLQSVNILSDIFVVRGCKWQLNAYKGNNVQNFLSLFLEVAGYGSLPSGWRRHARFRLIVVNQRSETLSRQLEGQNWFEEKANGWGFQSMLSLDEINAKDSGFLVNKELKIIVEIELLEVIGKVDVNGFHLLSSEVESVSRMFEKHPETASEVHLKNPNLRTGYMSLLLSLIDTLCQSPHKLPKDDLGEAYYALESLTDAGFKLDWLEKKISQVSERKEKEKDGEIRKKAVEKELKDLKEKCSDLEAQLEKEKSEALAAKTPISFDDIIQ
ncbi:hypothetical protein DY000_02061703 [Brassica cretica]|uniref:MATH domain-containing protein n=2 Tax=Brassica cretica TaxID=69181 RepID=A0ABQ7AV87_BRACR|nr:hypothetical protein DY000_02061703 [Brassica cretica]